MDYLLAQLSMDRNYFNFAEYILWYYKDSFIKRKDKILEFVENRELILKIYRLKHKNQTNKYKLTNLMYFIR